VALCLSAASGAVAVQQFPLQAMVLRDGAMVHSGPGAMHYGTAELERGTLVEVWRFDPGDWCAIRPEEGSFCLVPATAVESSGNGMGQVIEDGLQVWVGTRLGPVEKPLWQVKLERGEEVEILGRSSWPNPEGFPTEWLQIAPPAGEFRWMKRSDLQLPDEKTLLPAGQRESAIRRGPQGVVRTGFAAEPPPQDATPSLDDPFAGLDMQQLAAFPAEPVSGRATANTEPLPGELPPRDAGWRPARKPFQLAPERNQAALADRSDAVPPVGGSWSNAAGSLQVSTQLPNDSRLASLPIERFADQAAATQPTFAGERLVPTLAELDLRISAEIVKPAEYWDLESLASQILRAQAAATTDLERDQAGRLVRKVDQLRITRTGLLGGKETATVPAIASPGRPVGSGVDTSVELGATYDAHGWLNELVQQNGSAGSTYVLQDQTGRITHHIGAEPGLNLHRYLRQRIGVVGQRGYNQRLKLSHVTAERVVVLESNPLTTASRF
jgi:hypothetical protein